MIHLILTVGTGTESRRGDLAHGLRKTLEYINPVKFYLVPSAHPDSTAMADLVREGFDAFQPASPSQPYHCIGNPDDLECCRATVRAAIKTARAGLSQGDRIIVNPTSGTKQMSAGATLAALDEEIGDISFTVGQREGGIVISGTERITAFDPRSFFRERDLRLAQSSVNGSAFRQAAELLRPHREHLPMAAATAMMLSQWRDFDFIGAARTAAKVLPEWEGRLLARGKKIETRQPASDVIADLLAFSRHALDGGNDREALLLAYQTIEFSARDALIRLDILPDERGYHSLDSLLRLRLPKHLMQQLKVRAGMGGGISLGCTQCLQILKEIGNPLGESLSSDSTVLRGRNEHLHDLKPIKSGRPEAIIEKISKALQTSVQVTEATRLPLLLPFG